MRDKEVDEWSDDEEDEEEDDKEKFTFVSLEGVTLPDLSSVDTAYYVSGAIRIRGEARSECWSFVRILSLMLSQRPR